MPPSVILSLDCEGKWGMADHLQAYHHRLLTSANLAAAYRQLLRMLETHEIAATFAFVMAFALTRGEREQFPVFDPSRRSRDPWLEHYWRCQKTGLDDGWHAPDVFEQVRACGRHEIASHGFCHRPLGDESITEAGASEELADAVAAAGLKGVELKTLVFPRNEVGNLGAVRDAGYLGYRARLARPKGRSGRVAALLEEFDVHARPQQPAGPVDGLVAIPAGHFFNWRFGLRRLVPPAVTRQRWHGQLRQCARTGGAVHLWLHPHNLITGPSTAPVLAGVLQEIARLRDAGAIEVLTQRAYCERVAGH